MRQFTKWASAVAVAAVTGVCAVQSASAAVILTMGQSGQGTTVTGTNNGAGTTTITATNVAITISQILAAVATPQAAFLTLNATSTGGAAVVLGNVVQAFSGSFCITSAINCGGTNYLSATNFNDSVFGAAGGAALTLSAAEPPETVTFTSDVISAANLGLARGISFSFADVSPPVGITGGSLSSFAASVSGTFSANVGQVPEPATLALLGVALAGLGLVRRKAA